MQKLAEAIILAAEIRETSYDSEKAKKVIERNEIEDMMKFYTVSLREACKRAAEKKDVDAEVVYLLLKCCWNDALYWAEETIDK